MSIRRPASIHSFGENMLKFHRGLFLGLAAAACVQIPALSLAQTGSIEGQIIFDGAAPVLPPKVAKGDPTAKDKEVCAVNEVPDESLVVDPTTKGIANVVVYLKKAPAGMPAALKVAKVKEAEFDQKGCRFFPHILAVRTDQTVKCLSNDAVAHNVNITPLINDSKNFIVPPNDKAGVDVKMPKAEGLPVNVKCDIHSWMQALWVVTDHPYVAVTDKEGKFKIEDLPVGEHSFTVWEEKSGYLERAYKVNVKAGLQTLPSLKVPAAKFEKK